MRFYGLSLWDVLKIFVDFRLILHTSLFTQNPCLKSCLRISFLIYYSCEISPYSWSGTRTVMSSSLSKWSMIKLRVLLTSQALVMEWAKSQFVCQVFLSSEDEHLSADHVAWSTSLSHLKREQIKQLILSYGSRGSFWDPPQVLLNPQPPLI